MRRRKLRHVEISAVYRFVTEHWDRCVTRRCLLVDQEYLIVRGI